MMRLLDVPKGTVFVGGRDVTDLDLSVLRGAFGYVPQSHMLFSKSLAENIAFGAPDVDRRAIEAAASDAALDADVSVLPNGLDTQVGERGVTLSGGQKQRAAIARALVVEPPILVLDDALSSVDTETEAEILASLRQARAGLTTVIVAHRVTAVQHADQIVVLDAGRVVERGDHDTLSKAGGPYAQMARRQQLEEGLARQMAAAG
jgi:ABC-type multidrug transport system fused ATPase/permease subunit